MAQYPTTVGVYEASSCGEEHVVDAKSLQHAGHQEEPVTWVGNIQFGVTGMLSTDESHRRRGLARLALQVFARVQHQQGMVAEALVEDYNDASKKLFSSLPGWRSVPRTLIVAVQCAPR